MVGECPRCGAPTVDLSHAGRRDDRTLPDGRTEALVVAEPCGHEVLVRYRDWTFEDPELLEP